MERPKDETHVKLLISLVAKISDIFGNVNVNRLFFIWEIKGTVSRESLQKYKSAKTHLQQWQATGSGAFS